MVEERSEPRSGTPRSIRLPQDLWDDLADLAVKRGLEEPSRLIRFELRKIRDKARETREI